MSRQNMARLGRRGGLRGGVARAASLVPERRSEIARKAARARWITPVLVFGRGPRNHGELLSVVAHYGSPVSKGFLKGDLGDVVLRALAAARKDSALAKMLPVFLWRVEHLLNLDELVKKAVVHKQAAALGYFLELMMKLRKSFRVEGRDPHRLDLPLKALRPFAHPKRPTYFFSSTSKYPFEAMVAKERTPLDALSWGLLTGTPTDSFESHFSKKV